MPNSAEKIPYEIITRSDGEFIVSVHPTGYKGQSVNAEIAGTSIIIYYSKEKSAELINFPDKVMKKVLQDGEFMIGELSGNGIDNAYLAVLEKSGVSLSLIHI